MAVPPDSLPARHGAVRWIEARPTTVLVALAAICLAAFLVSIPVPRVDGQLLGTDGFDYYVYLPSLVLDHDLDFTNQYATLRLNDAALPTQLTPTGRLANFSPIGAALLWMPFFLLAHVLALALNFVGIGIRLDGCGYWHQAFVIAGNIAYGGAGLVLAFHVARRVAAAGAALWATVLVAFAGNLVYYLTAESSMAHAVSVFGVGLFFVAWLRMRGQTGLGRAIVLGALVGLIALVRTQEVLLAVAPLLVDLHGCVREARERRTWRPVLLALRDALVMILVALLVYSPQAFVSHNLYGSWWKPPQLYARWEGLPQFTWWSPHFADVLFSAQRGLFAWHPVFLIALLGVVPLWRRDRTMAAAVILGVAGQAYVIGAWFDWSQGRAFGGRAFIGCLPLFAAALAVLLEAAVRGTPEAGLKSRPARWLVPTLGGLLIAANFLLFVEYRFDLAMLDRPVSWHDLGPGRVSFLLGNW